MAAIEPEIRGSSVLHRQQGFTDSCFRHGRFPLELHQTTRGGIADNGARHDSRKGTFEVQRIDLLLLNDSITPDLLPFLSDGVRWSRDSHSNPGAFDDFQPRS